jgi:hypothetical protein
MGDEQQGQEVEAERPRRRARLSHGRQGGTGEGFAQQVLGRGRKGGGPQRQRRQQELVGQQSPVVAMLRTATAQEQQLLEAGGDGSDHGLTRGVGPAIKAAAAGRGEPALGGPSGGGTDGTVGVAAATEGPACAACDVRAPGAAGEVLVEDDESQHPAGSGGYALAARIVGLGRSFLRRMKGTK